MSIYSSSWGLHRLRPMETATIIKTQRWGWGRGSLLLQGLDSVHWQPWWGLWSSAGYRPQPGSLEDTEKKAAICLSTNLSWGPLQGWLSNHQAKVLAIRSHGNVCMPLYPNYIKKYRSEYKRININQKGIHLRMLVTFNWEAQQSQQLEYLLIKLNEINVRW